MSIAKLWKSRIAKISKFLMIFVLIFSWLFSGWPQIFHFPPNIQRAEAAIALRAVSALATAANGNVSVAMPTGTVQNDVMILTVTAKDNVVITLPAGWTKFGELNNGTDLRSTLAWKRAVSGEAGPYTVTHSGGDAIIGAIISFSGVSTASNPINAVSTRANAASSTVTADAITPSAANTMVVFTSHYATNKTHDGWSGTNPTFTEAYDYSTNLGSNAAIALAYGAKTDTTSTGERTVTAGGATTSIGVLFALKQSEPPNAPTQNSPANSATGVSVTPTFTMTTTDSDSDNLGYKVTIYSNSACTTVVQTNDQAISSTGWTGTNTTCTAAPTACYTSGTQGSFLTQTALSAGTQYWWKASAKDPDGTGNFTDSSTCNTFTTASAAEPISATASVDTAWVKGGSLGKNFVFTVNNGASSTAAIQWVRFTRPSANYTLTAGLATGWSATVTTSTVTFTGGSIAINSSANFTVTGDLASVDEARTAWAVSPDDDASGASPTTATESSADALKTGIDFTAPTNVGISSVTADSNTQLTAAALTATDSSSSLHTQPYWFDETSGLSGGSDSTDWQSSASWVDTGLSASTQYCYRVKARDAVLNESAFSTTVCQTTQAAADTTAPAAVTNLATSSPTNTSIVLTWTAPGDDGSTGTATSYDVRYSTSTITNDNWASASLATGEPTPLVAGSATSFTVTGLSASTTYHFALRTSDEVPNISGLSNVPSGITSATPDTTAPVISSVNATSITSSGATITWTTDEAADSQVEYGLTVSYGSQTGLDATLVTSHSVALSGLSSSALYHYRVKSKDAAANLATSSDFTFTTAAPPPVGERPPNISNINVVDITINSARVTWNTDKSATSQVAYGPTQVYEFQTPEYGILTTSHSVVLTELKQNTLYYYLVKSKSTAGSESLVSGLTFTTLQDITPPIISDIKITVISHNSINVIWTSSETADSQIEYGQTEKYGFLTDLDKNLVTSHSLTVSGLKAETLYYYRVISKDVSANEAKSKGFSVTTNPTPDTTGPIISDIKIVSLRQSTAKITWKTNEPATSKVIFGLEKGSYPKETIEFATLVLSHEINLGDLEAAAIYYYKVRSRDARGNETLSEELNFKTESLDIITEITVPKPAAALPGAKGTTDLRVTLGEVVTDVPILATKGDQEPPVAIILPFKENPTANASPIIAGEIADRQGVIASLSYSTDNGLTWHPVKEVKGIGTKKVAFTAQPIHLNDGNYPIMIRARDNSGNIGYSKAATLIIDALPPATGGNVILVGTQALIPNAFGLVNTLSGITQRMVVSSSGGAIEIKLVASGPAEEDLIFPLTFSKATNLWFGDIIFQKPGLYNFKITAIDGAGKISEKPINPFQVFESGKVINKKNNLPVKGAEVSVWQLDEITNQWLLWPGEIYNQANPQITGEDGYYRFLVPPGKYYLKVDEASHRTFYSRILKFKEHQAINLEIQALLQPVFTFRLPFLGEKRLSVNLPDFFSARRTPKPPTIAIQEIEYVKNFIGKPAPIFSLLDTKGEILNIRYQRGKKLILTTWTTWSPLAQSQIPLLDEISKEDQEVRAILLSVQESSGVADVYLRRGGYIIPSVVDPKGELLKLYPILTFPQHFIIDRKGIIRDIHIGFLKKEGLEEKIKGL